jgi:hypothetical protein
VPGGGARATRGQQVWRGDVNPGRWLGLSRWCQSRMRRAASCRPIRSWPPGRRSGCPPALPYPPPGPTLS